MDQCISCSLPNKNEYLEFLDPVKTAKSYYHSQTCGKKKGVSRFNASYLAANKRLNIHKIENADEPGTCGVKLLLTKSSLTLSRYMILMK